MLTKFSSADSETDCIVNLHNSTVAAVVLNMFLLQFTYFRFEKCATSEHTTGDS